MRWKVGISEKVIKAAGDNAASLASPAFNAAAAAGSMRGYTCVTCVWEAQRHKASMKKIGIYMTWCGSGTP